MLQSLLYVYIMMDKLKIMLKSICMILLLIIVLTDHKNTDDLSIFDVLITVGCIYNMLFIDLERFN